MSQPTAFTHLHVRSYFSLLEGLAAPSALAAAAARDGMTSLALTDHIGLTGAVEFYEACQSVGVRPILGLELDVTPPPDFSLAAPAAEAFPLLLLAMDLTGWGAICRLSSAALADPTIATPTLAFERLAAETDGVLCLSGGRTGLAARLLAQAGGEQDGQRWLGLLHEAFPGRLYAELQRHTDEDHAWTVRLSALAARLSIPAVATHNIFYLQPDQSHLQSVVCAIRRNQTLDRLPPSAIAPPQAHFLTSAEMAARFVDLPHALNATQEVVARCQLALPLGVAHFPKLDLPDGLTPLETLRQKAAHGARRLYSTANDETRQAVQARLDHELAVIAQCGYAVLFLIVEEILNFARRQGIPFSSRGSAASSLVAHCLGITSPDPIRLNLFFERFLNPARATPPDIDTDLCSRHREEVIRYVYQRFGAEQVATVCTITRYRRRSALRETAKAHGLEPKAVSTLADGLPHRWYGPRAEDDDDTPFGELHQRYPEHAAVFQDAETLLGIPRHLSVHPGGVVVAPGALTDLVPVQMAAKGVMITQFDLEAIERMGLVKIDLLGIRGLTVLGDVRAGALGSSSISHPAGETDFVDQVETIPDEDPETAELVRTGRTIGCFQIESPGMRATLKEIQAHSIDDLMAALALYRPGPLTGGLKDAFVRRHRGQEAVSQLHPALTPLLADTYGVILYQEQVLRIAHELAGLSLAEADLLRRAMSHFDPGKQMQTLKEKFVAAVGTRHNMPEAVAVKVWELMAAFAGYGFPKAHAASYALVSWRLAWCKVHFPALFMASVLANWGGYYSQRVYLTEARRLGLSVRPPHVNHANREFSVQRLDGEEVLFMGLDQVRELTHRTQTRIIRQRPFHSLADFLSRADPRPQEAETLARAGALAGFGPTPRLLRTIQAGGWQGGQLPLFSIFDPAGAGAEEWSLTEQAAAQEAVLGLSVAVHPLELKSAAIAASGALNTVEAVARLGQRVRVAGMRQTWRRSQTAHGEAIYFMALEDLEGMLDVVISSEVYQRWRIALSGAGPYLVEGMLELDRGRGEAYLRAERLERI